jgi:hypothetical protein
MRWENKAYLQYLAELTGDFPLLLIHLIFPELHIMVRGDGIKSHLIFKGKVEHVICRVPSGRDVPWHHAALKFEFIECHIPPW